MGRRIAYRTRARPFWGESRTCGSVAERRQRCADSGDELGMACKNVRRSDGRWYINDPGRGVFLKHHAAEQATNGGEDRPQKAPDHQRYGLRKDEEREGRRTAAADALEHVAEIRRHRSGHLDGALRQLAIKGADD